MRLLCLGDLHYALPKYDWLLQVAADFDLIVIAGDHLDITRTVDVRAQKVVVQKYLARLRQLVPVLTCSGNHDLDARNAQGEKVANWVRDLNGAGIPSDGSSFVLDGTLFTMCPWWDGPTVREEIGQQLRRDSLRREGRRWIWLHHAPPSDSPTCWDGRRAFGDLELREWIEEFRPDVVVCGHVHQSPFVDDGSWVDQVAGTWVFNAGFRFSSPPPHIVIDTDAGTAVWLTVEAGEEVQLHRPLERPVQRLTSLPDRLTSSGQERDQNPS